MKKRIVLFKQALALCELQLAKTPDLFPLHPAIDQIKYLISIEEGSIKDFSILENIKIGWIAVRELDGLENKDLIEILCQVSTEANNMLKEKKQ